MSAQSDREEIARIAAIVAERVREALRVDPRATPGVAPPDGPRALAVFTGGRVGLAVALQQLTELQAAGWQMDALLSPRAGQVIGRARVQAVCAAVLEPDPAAPLSELLAPYRVVLVPVLSRSTAARLAVGITDTLAAEAVWEALMLGKPVIAARDAADPAAECPSVATAQAAPAVRRLLAAHLDRLAEFGVRLVGAGGLAAAARDVAEDRPAAAASPARTIVTGEDVQRAAENGERRIRVGSGSQVTHVAREMAQRLGIAIEIE